MEVNLDPPRFRLTDVTQAAGEALKLLTPAERLASDRSVAVVLQGMIDRLKALPPTDTQVNSDLQARLNRLRPDGAEQVEHDFLDV